MSCKLVFCRNLCGLHICLPFRNRTNFYKTLIYNPFWPMIHAIPIIICYTIAKMYMPNAIYKYTLQIWLTFTFKQVKCISTVLIFFFAHFASNWLMSSRTSILVYRVKHILVYDCKYIAYYWNSVNHWFWLKHPKYFLHLSYSAVQNIRNHLNDSVKYHLHFI